MSSQKPDNALLSEPPCWGSGEIPLLPVEAARRLKSAEVYGSKGLRAARPPLMLSSLASVDWTSHVAGYECEDDEKCLADLVVDSLRIRMERWPLSFNFVVVPDQLGRVERLTCIPFLVETVERLGEIGKFDESGIRQLLSSTFIEAFELMGDVRAVLDLFVTGQSWLTRGRGGRLEIARFVETMNLAEESNLMALRYARTLGVSPTSKYYSKEKALVYGRRFGVSLHGEVTLAECAEDLGVSSERVRQIFGRLPVRFARRQWPMSEWASRIQAHLLGRQQHENIRLTAGARQTESLKRKDMEQFISMYGLAPTSYRPNNNLEGRLAEYRLTLQKIELECYRASESLGFVHESTALDRLAEVFAPVDTTLLNEAMRAIHRFELPNGYLYFDGSAGSSYFFGAASRVLSFSGSIQMEELYQAAARHAQYRLPHCVFPPRKVVRSLLAQDPRFVVDDDSVDIANPINVGLDGVAGWMYSTISEAPGRVIYRPELLDKARRTRLNGRPVNGSSVQVFMIRHELFKTCGRNCVTLTGVFPSDQAIEMAHARGQAVRVVTEATWKPRGNKFVIELIAGTDLCDGGLLILDRSLVAMFGGRRLKIMVSRSHHGHVGWSTGTTTGWSTAMRRAEVAPGDRVEITIDAASDTARVKKIG